MRLSTKQRFPGRQGRLVFAYLVAAQGRPVPRDELAEALWGDAPPATWEKALSVLVSKLRALLTECGLDGVEHLTSAFGCYQLTLPADTWIDVVAADEAANAAERALAAGDLERARVEASTAESLARRTFLPGEDGRWVAEQRDRLRETLVRALDCLAEVSLVGRAGGCDPRRRGADRPRAVSRDRLPPPDGGAQSPPAIAPRRSGCTSSADTCSRRSSGPIRRRDRGDLPRPARSAASGCGRRRRGGTAASVAEPESASTTAPRRFAHSGDRGLRRGDRAARRRGHPRRGMDGGAAGPRWRRTRSSPSTRPGRSRRPFRSAPDRPRSRPAQARCGSRTSTTRA